MLVFDNIKKLQQHLFPISADQTVGFVPTMGALHEGHLSLIKKAKKKNNIVVVSIFVNPTQFDKLEDLEKYPRTLNADIKLLKTVDCDILFIPSASEIYSDNIQSESFNFDGLEYQMEGKFRDGHFDGVGTIVKRLFEIVQPNNAYFGEKDFQQLQIIKKLVEKHAIDIKIKGCKIHREDDGLAMSSRNTRLTKEYRKAAPYIYQTLKKAKKKFGTKNAVEVIQWVEKKFKKHPILELEYFEIADEKTLLPIIKKEHNRNYRAFIAVFAGKIRLIDNIRL
ncbi:pantoate--beta-alanine ligase [Urechidicola croceus]|uniref:Pantothenate synthetase n=1 Tax=Urechidicola croceus TaxID=1850246 RepID=A0A1D8P8W0_9FLAO|nr:pantoate--beta-alanine ligase [Urechidicola croceus]AOW21023.1 pantoate--beta-alanine ligase [Urechidicola croceus]